MKATIFDIQRGSFVDGPGIRTTVFFKGCNLRCAWCHNPESQSPRPQMLFYRNKCTGCGKCKEKCPHGMAQCDLCGTCTLYCPSGAREICGRDYTVVELLAELCKDKDFYARSGGGVTFSGGECMLQLDFLKEILRQSKENGLHTAVDTAGHVPYASFLEVLPYTDLFLYDVKSMEEGRHKQYTGVGNGQILANLGRLLQGGARVWVRVPIIPGVNDEDEDIHSLNRFFAENGRPKKVELLPYHALGEHKYAAAGKEATRFAVPGEEKMAHLRALLQA